MNIANKTCPSCADNQANGTNTMNQYINPAYNVTMPNSFSAMSYPRHTIPNGNYIDLSTGMMPCGYDYMDNMDRDCDYMKHMYPSGCKEIQKHVEDACDQLEYEGSCMFDQCPDKVYLNIIVARIYQKVIHLNDTAKGMEVEVEECNCGCKGRNCQIPYHCPYYCEDGSPNWLRSLTEIMFYNEIQNRRRRYRSRKNWW